MKRSTKRVLWIGAAGLVGLYLLARYEATKLGEAIGRGVGGQAGPGGVV